MLSVLTMPKKRCKGSSCCAKRVPPFRHDVCVWDAEPLQILRTWSKHESLVRLLLPHSFGGLCIFFNGMRDNCENSEQRLWPERATENKNPLMLLETFNGMYSCMMAAALLCLLELDCPTKSRVMMKHCCGVFLFLRFTIFSGWAKLWGKTAREMIGLTEIGIDMMGCRMKAINAFARELFHHRYLVNPPPPTYVPALTKN